MPIPLAAAVTIHIVIGNNIAVAELDDNPTTRHFLTLLPLSAQLEDFAGKEKIHYLPIKLATAAPPPNAPANTWDIAYYVPWGNIAIFYHPYAPSPDLIPMGRILSGREHLTQARSFQARFELAPTQTKIPTQGAQPMPDILITNSRSQPPSAGPASYFTGSVRVEPLLTVIEPSRMAGARVTFEPGARTAWHTHPLGQTLIVTAGSGWVQKWGGPVEEFHEGDVVRIAPGVKHWHGATPASPMTHIALQEQLDGKVVEWMEQVTATQYRRP